MTDPAAITIRGLYRYPVKGLSPEPLEQVRLKSGETIPFDRAYAIENGPGRFDPEGPRHLPKFNFLMLMRHERLAALQSRFDEATQILTILRDGKQVARGQLTTPIGRKLVEQFLAGYMSAELRGAPKIVFAPGHSFSDVSAKCLHIINLASVRELERVLGFPINPLRFRPNLIIDGLDPWGEFDYSEKEFSIGHARLSGFSRTQRCAATDVDPGSAKRDTAIPAVLLRTWGHSDFGIYARIIEDGLVTVGDAVSR